MDWQNLEQIREAIKQVNPQRQLMVTKPCERWGHVAVAVQKEMYIIGGYHGKSHFSLSRLTFDRVLSR